ncbi:hypothetical protein B5M09_006901 [Aphanomyces astaci]|uniref:Uncharacterized protein n=1 Tax=Aphanomyces astaci TaxID=112090 RepID=A0A425CMG9_APHAT|nr:hypothetical protein B5M09_006901 [Aphanomyces astaci]
MSDQAVIQVDQVVSVGNLTAEVKSTDVPLGTWMTGERLEMALGDSPPSILHFEFNRVRQSWHYGWRSNRFNCNIKHAFVSDDDVKAEASPQRKRTRTTKSSTATSSSTDDDAVFLLPNHNEDDELMHTAVQEMLQLAEVYARSGTLNISATAPSTYAVLIDLLDTHVFTRTTLQFIQGCLEQGQVDLHRSFRQLLWLMWKQASEDLETRRQLTIGHVLGHIQQAFPWCDLTQGYYDPWFHHYTTLAAEVNKWWRHLDCTGDTLVVEWYFWPSQEDLPRKRVRERFTLLASTINSMMCQQFVELCWDNIHDIVVGPDVAQRVLLPANWQVHHIETYYYHRILAES